MSSDEKHIVMLPFMAQGHLFPFLALARRLILRRPSVVITIATTPINATTLHSSLSDDHPTDRRISIAALPYSPADHSLPAGAENTDSLPVADLIRLFRSGESLRPHFASLLSSLRPICVVADAFAAWTVDLARSVSASHAIFTTCGAYGTAAYFSFWLHLPHIAAASSPEFRLPGFPKSLVLRRSRLSSYARASDGRDPWAAFFRRQIAFCLRSDVMLCNTVEAVEIYGLQLLRNTSPNNRVLAIGPLLRKNSGDSIRHFFEWLAGRKKRTVVYVSFGTQNSITRSQMMALANGLEASGKAFIWAVRAPTGGGEDAGDEDWLPEGFEERVCERGLVVRKWAPQTEILSHESTGLFVSHCGWNSVLESLAGGVPIIGWPIAGEQYYNAKMVAEELGVGVEMARGDEGEVDGAEIERVIREVMGEGGNAMREKAEWFAEKMREAAEEEKGSSEMAVEEFVSWAVGERRELGVISNNGQCKREVNNRVVEETDRIFLGSISDDY